jgi:microcompartment protein CcmK/EutM
MKKLLFVGLVVLTSCGSASTKEVNSDSTSVKADTVKAIVDSIKVDSLKK